MSAPAIDPVLQLALRAGAALLFLSAAAHKLRRPSRFRAALADYDLLPRPALGPFAAGLAVAELAVGLGCLAPASAPAACLAGAALLALYSGAVALALGRGRSRIDCGCGGPGGPRPIGAGLLGRNALLVGMLGVAALPALARPWTWLDGLTLPALVATLALLHAAADVALANAARLRGWAEAPWSTR